MNLDISIYLTCTVIAVVNLLLTAVLLFTLRKSRNIQANRILGVVLLLLGASFMSDVLRTIRFFNYYPNWFEYDTPMSL